jgi:spore cortex formation protein SpoVR/YcgB (stage V sporulation)
VYLSVGHIEGGWENVRDDLAAKYKEGGYPEIADMLNSAK